MIFLLFLNICITARIPMKQKSLFILIILSLCGSMSANYEVSESKSYYKLKPEDQDAIYFTSDNYKIKSDGNSDISDELQGAIDKLKLENNFGIIFIPEGVYAISKTIYIPAAIRIIGYGKKRPLIVLRKNTPGYQTPVPSDKGKSNYMFWFTSSVVEKGKPVNDAGAGTFYSALSNIDLKIEDGNPEAVALRTHFAQHSFVSHCDIFIGKGKAGLFDIGNEMEDVRFFGGDYGIYTTKASPGWQFMMLDTWFEGQRKAAIKTQQAGLTIVRMTARNVPGVIKVDSNYWEKLYMEDCLFENVKGPAISFDDEDNANMQINLRNVACRNVPVPVKYLKSNQSTIGPASVYNIIKYVYGLQMNGLDSPPRIETTFETENLMKLPPSRGSDIASLPPMESWANIKLLGAKCDGVSDDTKIIQDAIEKYSTLYFPQGLYRISETIKLKPNSVLIGLHPVATQFVLAESTVSFSGFGAPKPMIEVPQGGTNIITGIGISTGEYNYRAVACKWMAGSKSLMDDVKFIGGHGSMKKGPYVPWGGYGIPGKKPSPVPGVDPAWDTQYWSLWITNGGGGIFKNIWTASTYATSGIYVSNTSTTSSVYAMSVEHHVRNEVRFSNVSNWKVYALQLEEESRESSECQPMEIINCTNLIFANLYMFRVIRVKTPYPYSIRTWDCKNIEMLNVHNYSQVKYTTDNPLFDINTNRELRPQEFARLFIGGDTPGNFNSSSSDTLKMLAGGFEVCAMIQKEIYISASSG
jgi:Pectate lyase superfamily protein